MTAGRAGRVRLAAEARPVEIAAGRVRIARPVIGRVGRAPAVIVRAATGRRATGGEGIVGPAGVRRIAAMHRARSARPRPRS
jgi:hypothetical protein